MGGVVLVVSNRFDPHVDHVLTTLRSRGVGAKRLNFEENCIDVGLSFGFNPQTGHFRTRNDTISFGDIQSVWWRRPLPYNPPPGLSASEIKFIKTEWSSVFSGMWASLDCKWVSRPENIRRAGWKPLQLKRAQALGFSIPRTLISNQPEEVMEFCRECGGTIVFKTLTPAIVGDSNSLTASIVRTTCISREQLGKVVDKVKAVPCLFQELVPKKFEIRATVVGSKVFAARIDSQNEEMTRIDWRAGGAAAIGRLTSAGHLPDDCVRRCVQLVQEFGLGFSAIDLIVTPDDRIIFLESNPNGQWLFIEKLLPEFAITDSLIDELTV